MGREGSYSPISAAVFAANMFGKEMRLLMSARQAIDELVGMMRARALRYKTLAQELYDRQTAAEVVAYADELEAEAERLADPRWPLPAQRRAITCSDGDRRPI